MKAAFAKIDYTPAVGTRLGRLAINILRTESVQGPLHARLALFDDGQTKAGILTLDQNVVIAPVVAELRQALASQTGLLPENFFVAATHCHNCPPLHPWLPDDELDGFMETLRRQLAELAARTWQRLEPVRWEVVSAQAPGWSYNRRPLYRSATGRDQAGTHGPRTGADFVRMEGEDESDLRALIARGTTGNVVGGLVNFGCHPVTMYNVPAFSSDYPGRLLDAVEAHHGGTFVFLNGAAGDLAPGDHLRAKMSGPELAAAMGTGLAQTLITQGTTGLVVPGRLQVGREILSIPQRRVTGRQVKIALEYLATRTSRSLPFDLFGADYIFHHRGVEVDEWFAHEIIGLWEWQRRHGERELIERLEMQAVTFGDVAIVGFPGEPFRALGTEVRARSPFPHTFVVELANGWHGYIPTEEAFAHGGYETSLGMPNRLVTTAGTQMTQAAQRLLSTLH